MGAAQGSDLNTDSDGKATTGRWGDLGDGNTQWYLNAKIANGGDAAMGATTDASAAGNGSLIAIIKYLRSALVAEDAVAASGDLGIPVFAARNDALATLTSASGDYGLTAIGSSGEVFSTPTPPLAATQAAAVALSEAATTALATNLVIKASAGTLYKITGYNNNAAVRYLQIANLVSLGADGTIPAWVYAIPATSSFAIDWGIYGRRFTTGIVACFSTTLATKTIAAADMWLNASYK